jgi:hypothetical protein
MNNRFSRSLEPQHRSLYPDGRRRYIGGFDPGSGWAEMWTAPEDDPDAVAHFAIPSWVSLGTLEDIGKRSRLLNADPVEELESDEFVIGFDGVERYAGRLGRDGGSERTNALNDPRRYSNEHALTLFFALASELIPEDRFTLRYVTAIPMSLYNDENRQQVQNAFTRTFQYQWNGQAKNGEIVCGAVVPEGAGGLMLYGDTTSKTLVVDYGMRTTDVLIARGQKVDVNSSKGFPIGVSQLISAFNDEFFKLPNVKRRLEEGEAETLLRCYVQGVELPEVKSSRQIIDPGKIKTILDKVYDRIGKQSNTEIARIVNEDQSGAIAASFDLVIPIGGGAYHFKKSLDSLIPNVEDIRHAQSANPEGYFEIAISFTEATWEKVIDNVAARTGGAVQHA